MSIDYANALSRDNWDKHGERPSLLDFIPGSLHKAIRLGTDTSDLTLPMQNAIQNPQVACLDVPVGVYCFTDCKLRSNLIIQGKGISKSVFLFTGVSGAALHGPAGALFDLQNLVLRDLTIMIGAHGLTALNLNGAREIVIERCQFLNFNEGILLDATSYGCATVRISECRFTNCTTGIHLTGEVASTSSGHWISKNRFESVETGILADAGSLVKANYIGENYLSSTATSIDYEGDYSVLEGNYVEGGTTGIKLRGTNNFLAGNVYATALATKLDKDDTLLNSYSENGLPEPLYQYSGGALGSVFEMTSAAGNPRFRLSRESSISDHRVWEAAVLCPNPANFDDNKFVIRQMHDNGTEKLVCLTINDTGETGVRSNFWVASRAISTTGGALPDGSILLDSGGALYVMTGGEWLQCAVFQTNGDLIVALNGSPGRLLIGSTGVMFYSSGNEAVVEGAKVKINFGGGDEAVFGDNTLTFNSWGGMGGVFAQDGRLGYVPMTATSFAKIPALENVNNNIQVQLDALSGRISQVESDLANHSHSVNCSSAAVDAVPSSHSHSISIS